MLKLEKREFKCAGVVELSSAARVRPGLKLKSTGSPDLETVKNIF